MIDPVTITIFAGLATILNALISLLKFFGLGAAAAKFETIRDLAKNDPEELEQVLNANGYTPEGFASFIKGISKGNISSFMDDINNFKL
jgi:hypothetical protein